MKTKRLLVAIVLQLVLVLCIMVSTGEAVNKTLRDTNINIDTFAKVDNATSSYTGLNSYTVDGIERAWQQWFWYRVGPAGGETSLDKLTKTTPSQPTPSSLLLTYTLASQFDISIHYELTPYLSGAGKAGLKKTVTITNTSTADLDYHLFEFSDYDLSETGEVVGDNDNVEVINNKVYQNGSQSSGGVTLVHESSLPPSKFDIDNGSGAVKGDLTDTEPSDFSNPQTPYSYGSDIQFVKQWDITIPAGQSVSFTITDSFYPTLPVTASVINPSSCVTYGGQADYTINFDNLANNSAGTEDLTSFKVIDYLPKNTTPTINPPVDGSIYDPIANTVTWSLPTLEAGAAQQTRQLSTNVNSATDLFNNVLLVSDQAFPTRIPVSDFTVDPVPTSLLCNHPPTMTDISKTPINKNEGDAFSIQVVALDQDKDSLAYSLSGAPAGMTISSTGLISWASCVAGTYAITATATDSGPGSLTVSKTFTLIVTKVNHPPAITSTPVTTATNGVQYKYTVTATDQDNDALTFFPSSFPGGSNMAINPTTGEITWTPVKTAALFPQYVKVGVTDGTNYGYQEFNITVTTTNPNIPVISTTNPPATTAIVGTPYSYQVAASDKDYDTLYYKLTSFPVGMKIGVIPTKIGLIEWTPTADQVNNSFPVTVEVVDGYGGVATLSYSITVGAESAKTTPVITWTNPVAITFGTALSVTQLNATANVPGTFVYNPAVGTILTAGNKILSAA